MTCTVRFAAAARASSTARVRLSRDGVTYARGRGSVRRGQVRVPLRATRRLRAGRYLLTTVVTDRRGRSTVIRRTAVVR